MKFAAHPFQLNGMSSTINNRRQALPAGSNATSKDKGGGCTTSNRMWAARALIMGGNNKPKDSSL